MSVNKYSNDEIKQATQDFFSRGNDDVPDLIKILGLDVSYKVGW